MGQPGRGRDGAALERKIRAAGRPWTIGDVVMVADGQWAVPTKTATEYAQDRLAEMRTADSRRVEMTLEELARAVGATDPGTHRDADGN
ncbi:hypothetical protein OG455_38035 [Kitasatospora sp. NBC_01287]|uniref:hypothetical protein n=1 Tax=Kitasatospora sp. NBC_01287 TaxID=2903573 RepID=UPI00225210BA|nr:hypothetical protein [Kitasatospora sp. NBC_01287]MCX4751238.1 hypothetical protein [Kitasatospora sp. NBC_01287]